MSSEHRSGREVGLLVGGWLRQGAILTTARVARLAHCSRSSAWRALRDASRVLPVEQKRCGNRSLWWITPSKLEPPTE